MNRVEAKADLLERLDERGLFDMGLLVGMADYGEGAAVKFVPAPQETEAEVLYGMPGQFEDRCDIFGFEAILAIEFEQCQEPPIFAKKRREIAFELIKLSLRFFFQQYAVGPWRRILNELNYADRFAVVEGHAREIGFIANEAVFRAVLEAVDVPSDAAFEVPLDFGDGHTEQLRML